MVLENIDYKKIFYYFEEISNIPRGSKNCQAISDYLVGFAKEHGLTYRQDEALNVIIKKPASAGYESCPPLILQGHMDMVCEKKSESSHDFFKDPLQLYVEEDYLAAKDTTLGGDDGAAVAYALAILDDDTLVHPPLEVVITTDEEIGLLGATALDTFDLEGRHMINIDSEDDDTLLVSCAGGMTAHCRIPVTTQKKTGKKLTVTIKGLLGGHSGSEIDKNRVNADILLGRLLYDLKKQSYEIISLAGGTKQNAIPREATAELLAAEADVYTILNEIKFLAEKYKNECRTNEPDLTILTTQGEEREYSCLDEDSKQRIICMLMDTPNGIQVMSSDISGLVESSLNLGVLSEENGEYCFDYGVRSSQATYKFYMSNKLEILTKQLGGTYSYDGEYPGWEYKKDSRLREIYTKAYQEMYGSVMKIEAIHAGLECGILAEKMGDVDIISVGPNMKDIHTTEERLSISSTKRLYDLICKVLKDFAEAMK
ncbi:MAG: aminoacyl-histidine dipeptidase [Acetivibrio ethanolgignens]